MCWGCLVCVMLRYGQPNRLQGTPPPAPPLKLPPHKDHEPSRGCCNVFEAACMRCLVLVAFLSLCCMTCLIGVPLIISCVCNGVLLGAAEPVGKVLFPNPKASPSHSALYSLSCRPCLYSCHATPCCFLQHAMPCHQCGYTVPVLYWVNCNQYAG